MTTKRKLKQIISLQSQLIERLKPYYVERPGAWIDDWYDSLTVRISKLLNNEKTKR